MKKIVIVTGTRKGIGKQLAEHYLSQGYIVAGCSRGKSSITDTNYIHYSVDVSDEKGVVDMVRDIKKQHSRIDILLNNAGIASMNHITITPLKSVTNIMHTNVIGSFLFLREAAKIMIRHKAGRIINFATVATPLRLEGEAVYAASKAAVVSLTEVAARELADFGITVNAIGPTPVPTDLIKNVPQDKMQALLNRQAIKRFGTVTDIINAIDFFIDDKSDFITGQVLYLGGVNH